MAKRFTDSEIWKRQRWFKKLTPDHKLVFFYIKDQCTHWGMWNIDCIDLMEDTGVENFILENFIDSVNTEYDKITGKKINKKRILLMPDNVLLITGFLQFQWENKAGILNLNAPAVKHGMQAIIANDLIDMYLSEGFITLDKSFEGLASIDEKITKIEGIVGNPSKVLGSGKVGDISTLNFKNDDNTKTGATNSQGKAVLSKSVAQIGSNK